MARWWHPKLLQSNSVIEFLSRVSYGMTRMSDQLSGVGVAIRSEVLGTQYGQLVRCCSTLHHPNTAEVAGMGTGAIAQLLLSGALRKAGVWTPEQALSTQMFEKAMGDRALEIHHQLLPNSIDHFFGTSTVEC